MLKELDEIVSLLPQVVVRPEIAVDTGIPASLTSELQRYLPDYRFDRHTSSIETEKGNILVFPNQYLHFAALVYPLATELYKYFRIYDAIGTGRRKGLPRSTSEIERAVTEDPELRELFGPPEDNGDSDVALFAKFLGDDGLGTDDDWGKSWWNNKGGRPARDVFGSMVLSKINTPNVSSEALGHLVYDLASETALYERIKVFFAEGGLGLARAEEILFKNDQTRVFVEGALRLLHDKDESAFFFTALEKRTSDGKRYAELTAGNNKTTRMFWVTEELASEEELSSANTPRWFKEPFRVGDALYYLSTQWVDDDKKESNRLRFDIFRDLFNSLESPFRITQEGKEYVLRRRGNSLAGAIQIPKPFILLAGISGTGKTQFVRRQAAATARDAQTPENFCLVPVRPDWHEPSDVLGYVSRIGDEPRFISTKALDFMIEAWRNVAPDANAEGLGELAPDAPPYWLCLDEMNLAPVEQYFADYLSVLETREVTEGVYRSEPLLQKDDLQKYEKGSGDLNYRRDLRLEGDRNEGLWQFFCAHGVQLPPNLIVAGTVNMDETTHGFSRKVIDRALTLDFGEFFPNDFDLIFGGQCEPVTLTYSFEARARQEELRDTFDGDGEKTIKFLKEVNGVLQRSPFELAYRALNEALLHVACFEPRDERGLQAVWDDFLMTKVLPRIEGDADKLISIQPDSASDLLGDLEELLSKRLSEIWNESDSGTRPDLFQKAADGQSDLTTDCRSRKKLQWMRRRLETNTFTSFWP